MLDFLLTGYANEEACHNSGGTGKLAAPESITKGTENIGSRRAGHKQDLCTGTPHLRDEHSRITRNTSKDERISGDAW